MVEAAGWSRRLAAALGFLVLVGCAASSGPATVDPKTGYLPVAVIPGMGLDKGSTVTDLRVDFEKYQGRMLVTGPTSAREQLAAIGAFGDVFDNDELQRRVIAAGLQDQVQNTDDPIGISRAYKYYKPFLWMHWEVKKEFGGVFARIIVTEPGTGQDLFIASTRACDAEGCMQNPGTLYPLFNSFIDWVRKNGRAVKTGPGN